MARQQTSQVEGATESDPVDDVAMDASGSVNKLLQRSIGIQTDPNIPITSDSGLEFSCCFEENNCVATLMRAPPPRIVQVNACTETVHAECRSQATITDASPINRSALEKLESDDDYRTVCGVPKAFFLQTEAQIGLRLKQNRAISTQGKLLLYFIKLKHNLSYMFLAKLFDIHRSTASEIFSEVLDAHYEVACKLVWWLSRAEVDATMPSSFKQLYPRTRVIIDCSEVKIESPSAVDAAVQCYSHYKSNHTMKFLIGVAPSGIITFISRAYGGRVTDGQITADSGLLDLLEAGDEVMADKGFPSIEASVLDCNAIIVMPPFKRGERQFSHSENRAGYNVASVRIHVERVLGRMKFFRIMKSLDHSLLNKIDKILMCIAFTVNHFPPLIREN